MVLFLKPAAPACGAAGQPCCSGGACGTGLACQNGACVAACPSPYEALVCGTGPGICAAGFHEATGLSQPPRLHDDREEAQHLGAEQDPHREAEEPDADVL